jgi:beta-N-acetylhexosaminidase
VALWMALADRGGGKKSQATAASQLSVRELAGERLIAGFSGTRVPGKLEDMIAHGDVAGVILFSENLPSRSGARRLVRHLQRIGRPRDLRDPLLIMTDQEGGLVKRLAGPPNASALQMGRRGTRYSRRQGRKTAANLKDVGVNVNLAPVLDVGRPGSAIRAQHRSFGRRPHRVIRTAIPFARAMERRGVSATGKHFPGLGAAPQDTDVAVQRIRLSKSKLRRIDERPYESLVAHHGDMVMISTAIYTHFSDRPAAFSKAIATGELRHRLDFEGVSISDALETASASDFGGPAKVGVATARAGTDLLLYTDHRSANAAGRALRNRLRSGRLDRSRFQDSVQRILDLRGRIGSR